MDAVLTRLHTGNKFIEISVPKWGAKPAVRCELIPEGEEASINEHSRFGAYLVDIQWPAGVDKPVVTIEPDASVVDGKSAGSRRS